MATQSVGAKTVRRNRAGASGIELRHRMRSDRGAIQTPPCSMNAKNCKNLSCPNWEREAKLRNLVTNETGPSLGCLEQSAYLAGA